MTTTTRMRNKTDKDKNRKPYRIFEESDGYHWCDARKDFLDARGKGYPTKKAAREAAENHFQNCDLQASSAVGGKQ